LVGLQRRVLAEGNVRDAHRVAQHHAVRPLTNAVHLKRTRGWFPLYLTPNDPKPFLQKITEFAPDLTRETIL